MWQASQLNGWLQTYCVLRSYLDHLVKRAVSSSGWSHGFPTVLIRVVSRSAAALNTLDMLLYKVTHFYLCSLYHQLCVAHRFSLFLEFLKIQLSSVLVRICIDCNVVKLKVAFFFSFFFSLLSLTGSFYAVCLPIRCYQIQWKDVTLQANADDFVTYFVCLHFLFSALCWMSPQGKMNFYFSF